jgi:acyl carrier protein
MLTPATIRATLRKLLEEETGNKAPLLEKDTPLREGLGLDSLDLVGLIMKIEAHYEIRLHHAELEQVVTVDDLSSLILRKASITGGMAAAA